LACRFYKEFSGFGSAATLSMINCWAKSGKGAGLPRPPSHTTGRAVPYPAVHDQTLESAHGIERRHQTQTIKIDLLEGCVHVTRTRYSTTGHARWWNSAMHVLRLARPSSDSWRGCRVVSIVATGYSAVYGTDENLVSVMMPFDRSFDTYMLRSSPLLLRV